MKVVAVNLSNQLICPDPKLILSAETPLSGPLWCRGKGLFTHWFPLFAGRLGCHGYSQLIFVCQGVRQIQVRAIWNHVFLTTFTQTWCYQVFRFYSKSFFNKNVFNKFVINFYLSIFIYIYLLSWYLHLKSCIRKAYMFYLKLSYLFKCIHLFIFHFIYLFNIYFSLINNNIFIFIIIICLHNIPDASIRPIYSGIDQVWGESILAKILAKQIFVDNNCDAIKQN